MSSSMFAILIGLLVSIIFYELTNISPGGVIVPSLMVLYFNQPQRLIYTVVVAIIAYFLIKLLSKRLIIFGKRRFVLLILVSLAISFLLGWLLNITSIGLINNISLVGYTVSGLIANDLYKQGIKRTIPSLIICLMITELIVLIGHQLGV